MLLLRSGMERACVKTPTRFDTDLFCSLFRALRPLGSEKIAKNFALRDCLQKFAGFSHGLGRAETFGMRSVDDGICQCFGPMNEAVFLHGPRDARVALFNLRECRPSETLVDVGAVGICRSDLHYYKDGGIG